MMRLTMKYVIKVLGTYMCDSSSGIQYLHEKDRAIKYDSKDEANKAAQFILKGTHYKYVIEPFDLNKIITQEQFDEAKAKHLEALKEIRSFILGDENNQPQVTYVPNMVKFDNLYKEMKAWVETSTFEADDE